MAYDEHIFLSTTAAGRSQQRLALAVVIASTLIFCAAAPFAQRQLAPLPPFISIVASALVVNDAITAVLLIGQFVLLRSMALLLLASGYLFTAAMAIIHAMTFPGLFSPAGLLGAGSQTTAWLYIFWHAGFPCFVIAYAYAKRGQQIARASRRHIGLTVMLGVLAAIVIALFLGFWATAFQDALPAVMAGNRISDAGKTVFAFMWIATILALGIMWYRRPHTVIDLWIMVTLCAWIFDIALSTVINAGRYDFGFYAGRVYGLLASGFVLAVLLLENGRLYAKLSDAFENERQHRNLLELTTTELKASNTQLEAFSYSVSHDLRAPLATLRGYVSLLEREHAAQLDHEGLRLLGVVHSQAEHMALLIQNLLMFARTGGQRVKTVTVDMEAIVRETLSETTNDYPAVRLEIGSLPHADGDRALLKQVWANLIGNALKYSSKRSEPRVQISSTRTDNGTEYWVKDNGAGFDSRHAHKLFGVFQRLHSNNEFPGTGVGLAIVQQVVARHGGQVGAEGEVGHGARFFFVLPRAL